MKVSISCNTTREIEVSDEFAPLLKDNKDDFCLMEKLTNSIQQNLSDNEFLSCILDEDGNTIWEF